MKYAVVGCRWFKDYKTLAKVLDEHKITAIVSGGARGTDTLAERYGAERGLPVEVVKPEWERFGKKAGPIRNIEIVKRADAVIAFWDGRSKGTASTIEITRMKNKRLIIVRIDDLPNLEI